MKLTNRILTILLLILIATVNLLAGEAADTLRTYILGDVVVTGDKFKKMLSPSIINDIEYGRIQSSDAISFNELAMYMPSGVIKTNSRGESLLYLRGAGERQIALFYDGALLNIPWDNRMDLSMIPTDIIGKVSISKGASSILFGPNVLGGAMNISTIERATDGFGGVVRLQAGDGNIQDISLTADGRAGNLNYITNVSYYNTDGSLLPEMDKEFINQNEGTAIRTNTDQKRLSAYMRGEYQFSKKFKMGISVNAINGEKGVAPEGHLESNTRFWRFPEWKRTMITLNTMAKDIITNDLNLKITTFADIFKQEINQYESIAYKNIEEIQKDNDLTFGGRLLLDYSTNDNSKIIFAYNTYLTKHDETIIQNADNTETNSIYNQFLNSFGMEYRYNLNNMVFTIGISADFNYAEKEDTDISDSSNDLGALFGLKYFFDDEFSIFANISRKSRFPTLREAYSDAMGKFKVNPDLKPEHGTLSELGLSYKQNGIMVQGAIFLNLYSDLIAKTRVPEGSLNKYIRINIDEAIIPGAEFAMFYSPLKNLNLDFNMTYIHPRGKEDGEFTRKLEYKPEILANLIANYKFAFGLILRTEASFNGVQYGDNATTNQFETIDPTLVLNTKIAYQLIAIQGIYTEIFLRLNNVFDEYKLYQLGLPEPGRTFYAGISTRF